jgi:hypothetical protein
VIQRRQENAMSSEHGPVVLDEWETYVRAGEDGPLFISFDVDATRADLSGPLPHCARVLVPIQRPNEAGGPVQPESDQLWELEDDLCQRLERHKVACRLVARLTHQGIRELVFQLADWDGFRPLVGQWMGEITGYAIDVSEHEGWGFFTDCVAPTVEEWFYIADSKVVSRLIEAGSDPQKDHDLAFVFDGAPANLTQAIEPLQRRGYVPLPPLDPASGTIVMVKRMPLDPLAIAGESMANAMVAEEFGIEFDGWGCTVVE